MTSSSDWTDGLADPGTLRKQLRARLSPDNEIKVALSDAAEFEAQGWAVSRPLKSAVWMTRPKPRDQAFEDRVWSMFAKLGFPQLNRDRHLRVPYGRSASETQQVDVFAGDGDVAFLVECKDSEIARPANLKSAVEALRGKKTGLFASVRKAFPDSRPKLVVATNNLVVGEADAERLDAAGIVHLDETAVEYFHELADHLGPAARYQLLGALFDREKIPGLDRAVPAIEGTMGGQRYYSFSIEPARLLKLTYVLHRTRANDSMMPTYQRLIKKTRLRKVADFVDADGYFPNSIIINVDAGRRGLKFEPAGAADGGTRENGARVGRLLLPQTYRAAYIIDGQHRLYGYAQSERAETDLIPVVAFVNLPRDEQVRMFMSINENQQAVPKNLRNTLNADLLWDADDLRDRARALKLRVAQELGDNKLSPLSDRLLLGEGTRTELRCVTLDAVKQGLDRGNLFGVYTSKERKARGTLDRDTPEETFRYAADFLIGVFRFMAESSPRQCALGAADGGVLFTNNGIEGLLRLVSDIVDHTLDQANATDTLSFRAAELAAAVERLLAPLANHLETLDPAEAAQFRGQYGSGGGKAYWHRFQQAVHAAHPEFAPATLTEYLEYEARAFNAESSDIVRRIEAFLSVDVRERLEQRYGRETWFKEGVPRGVQEKAGTEAVKRNVDLPVGEELEDWQCLHLIDYREIMTASASQWEELFSDDYTRPEDVGVSGRQKRTQWLVELNDARNAVSHNRSVSQEQYEFLVALRDWLPLGPH